MCAPSALVSLAGVAALRQLWRVWREQPPHVSVLGSKSHSRYHQSRYSCESRYSVTVVTSVAVVIAIRAAPHERVARCPRSACAEGVALTARRFDRSRRSFNDEQMLLAIARSARNEATVLTELLTWHPHAALHVHAHTRTLLALARSAHRTYFPNLRTSLACLLAY